MEKCWTEFSFPVPSPAIDEVSDLLYELGCNGINVEERQLDTFVVPDPDLDIPSCYSLKVYFPGNESRNSTRDRIVNALRPILPALASEQIKTAEIRNEDWAEDWKQHFSPSRFGQRLVIKPTWENWQGQSDEVIISLDPGMAFGTGSHETTRLCLQALADCYEVSSLQSVLDVGTGSGILAIAAAALGANRVFGCEIDAEACRVAAENVALNHVNDVVEISDRLLQDIEDEFDLVIANIMAEENVRLAPHLVERLAQPATLILSGILREKEDFVREAFDRFDLFEPRVTYEGEWCCIRYERGRR